jgi:hypothetical protein
MRIAFAVVVFLFFRAGPAAADLYRWIDPETGSIKYSSYPPPWYGDEAKQRRAPKVELIPAGSDTVARPEPGALPQEGARRMEALEAQRKAMLQQLSGLAAQAGSERGGPALQKQLGAYAVLADQIDRLNPEGAAARRGELQTAIEKIGKGAPR